jgi:glutathione S-transferase
MITLYHAQMTRSLRILWLLEELGLDYRLEKLDFLGGDLQRPAYLSKNPLGKVPTIEDGDVRMFESGAITEYLVEKYGNGRLAPPPGTPQRAQYLQWLHWSEATAMPAMADFFQHTMLRPEGQRIPQVAEEAKQRIARWLAMLNDHLAGKQYLLGDEFSAADVMMGYTVQGAKFGGMVDDRFPHVAAYAARLEARPAFRKASAG